MKSVFIGSSNESIAYAKRIADLLAQRGGVTPRLWSDWFRLGDITFLGIERVARECDGAVILAAPDDASSIRGVDTRVPRANVIFEYGFLSARLTRQRVCLCRFENTALPSDFAGLTTVDMGAFEPMGALSEKAAAALTAWARQLPTVQRGFPCVITSHGYSGEWRGDTTFSRWRGIDIRGDNYALLKTTMVLHLDAMGTSGCGAVFGTLQIQLDSCYAEFEVNDRVVFARVGVDGSLRIRLESQSRQQVRLDGQPPQADGFENTLRGGREFEFELTCQDGDAGKLVGTYTTRRGPAVYSVASQVYYRPALASGVTELDRGSTGDR